MCISEQVVPKMYMLPPSLTLNLLRSSSTLTGKFLTAIFACLYFVNSSLAVLLLKGNVSVIINCLPGKVLQAELEMYKCDMGEPGLQPYFIAIVL